MKLPRFKCFFKRKNKVPPVDDDGVDISAAGRNKNTANTKFSKDTDSKKSKVSFFAWCSKLFKKLRRKVDPVVETVSSAERNTNMDSTAAEIPTAIRNTNMDSTAAEIPTAIRDTNMDSTAAEIPTAIKDSSDPSDSAISIEVVSEITVSAEDNLNCVLSSGTMDGMNISPTEGTQKVTEVMSSPSPDSFARVEKLHGGVAWRSPVSKKRPTAKVRNIRNRGLKNFQYSCYINASLQSLFSMERFCTQLCIQLSDWFDHPFAELIRCFIELWSISEGPDQKRKNSVLRKFISAVTSTNPDFTTDTQNDAHEFLFYCLDQMQTICRTLSHAECPVTANLSFQLKNVITCTFCGDQKSRNEEFNHLALALEDPSSVENCLNRYLSDEEEIECRCYVCGCMSASSRWSFHTLPRVLILQLKRFQVSATSIGKQHSMIHIDPVLHLSLPAQSACTTDTSTGHQAHSSLRGGEDRAREEQKTASKELAGSVCAYSLISVLNHVGPNMFSGHYLSDCRQCDFSWLKFDDERVALTTLGEVKERRQRSAYVVFYERPE